MQSKTVRLSEFQIDAICIAFREFFPKNDHLWLFGSRADMSKKGGDIDLYIESTLESAERVSTARMRFLTQLQMSLGEQKIDVVVKFDDTDLLIYKIAKEKGVLLV